MVQVRAAHVFGEVLFVRVYSPVVLVSGPPFMSVMMMLPMVLFNNIKQYMFRPILRTMLHNLSRL